MKFAVIKTGGKQYFVKESDEIVVDHLKKEPGEKLDLTTLLVADEDKNKIDLGKPEAKTKVKAEVISNLKGDKIRVARFKAKTRYRKVRGFRPMLTKIKITDI